jgi:hypothetical protein
VPTLLALALMCGACAGDKAGDSGVSGPEDRDFDGYSEAEDCNDRDDTIFPGADDAWYDGVDQDCGGDDDFDADVDGHRSTEFGGLDCNDTDAAVSPDAVEVWYDGVDQNCDAEDDYDADRDGFASAEYATDGTDCNDDRSDVKPGAVEIWYDGTDGDCDGADDYDADGDGEASDIHAGDGTDCDDDDPEINTEATEVWYDGIDADCDGADDYDADGDGEAAFGEISTGSDCNDDDPTIFTGATERLDGLDSDCDEELDEFTSDQDVLGSIVYGNDPGDGIGIILAAGDLDQDGFDDLAVVQQTDDGITTAGYGLVAFVDGQVLSSGPVVAENPGLGVLTAATTTLATGPVEAVSLFSRFDDSTGGYALLGTPANVQSGDALGAAWVFSTDTSSSTRLEPGTYVPVKVVGETVDSGFGATVLASDDLDIDGDGNPELVVSAPDTDGGTVYIFYSANLPASTTSLVASDADVILTGAAATGALGSSLATGDFQGSGSPWLVIGDSDVNSGSGAVYVVETGFTSLESGPITNQATTVVQGVAGSQLGTAVAAGDTFDESGDGRDELIIGAPRAITRAGQLQMYRGTAIEAGGSPTCTSSGGASDACYLRYSGSAIDGLAGSALVSGRDVTGDGTDDILVGGPGNPPNGIGSGVTWLLVDTTTSASRSLNSADATFNGASTGDGLGQGMALGDFNGDGKADVAYGVPGHDNFGDEGIVRMYTSEFPDEGGAE